MPARRRTHPVCSWSLTVFTLAAMLGGRPAGAATRSTPELVSLRKVWDASPHNAFTDLTRYKGEWFCVFREGQGHVSPDGQVRVLRSKDGDEWKSATILKDPNADLRDPKLVVAPGNRLMLIAAAAYPATADVRHQTFSWFSSNGTTWQGPQRIGDPNFWLWRVAWQKNEALGIGYGTAGAKWVRLYRSSDAGEFQTLIPTLFDAGYPNETGIVFLPNRECVVLMRRDEASGSAQLGTAKPPYTEWHWQDLGVRVGGPALLRLPDGRLLAAGRLYDGGARTSLMWLDPERGSLNEFLRLPSGGDTSYPGLVWNKGLAWVSYYSSHEGRTSIYLAKVKPGR